MKGPAATKKMLVYRALREMALSLPPGAPLGDTIFGFARKFGVSHKTVQAAVKLLKSEGIITARTKVGLRVHPARPRTPRKENLLFLTVTEAEEEGFPGRIQQGVAEAAARYGLSLVRKNLKALREAVALAREGLISCAVISLYHPQRALARAAAELASLGVRVCAVDETVEGVDSVVLDNRSIGRLAARLILTRSARRRVLLLRRYGYAQAEYEREEGIVEILDDLGVPHSRVMWVSVYADPKELRRHLGSFLSRGLAFDAAFCHTPGLAVTLRELAREAGLPEPFLTAVGTEEELRETAVSGVAVSPEEMGRRAVDLVVERTRQPFAPARVVRTEGRIHIA